MMMLHLRNIVLLPLLTLSLLLTFTYAAPSELTFSRRNPPPRKVTVRHYTLNLTTDTLWRGTEPFGPTVLVNSTFPGPTLRARSGEILQVRVWNYLNHSSSDNAGNATVHFHGLSMKMHPVMDGTTMVSQWPITPGHYFDYRIPLTSEDKGTYFYHSHVGVQAMTAYGALVVEDPKGDNFVDPSSATMEEDKEGDVEFVDVWGEEGLEKNGKSGSKSPYRYDEDRVLAVGDWFGYSSLEQVERQLNGDPFVWPGSATKLALNGNTSPSTVACNQTKATALNISCSSAPAPSSAYPEIQVDYEKTYRLRFVGATSLMYVSIAILKPLSAPFGNATQEGSVGMEKLTLIEADGSYLNAFDVDYLEFTTGQRYSALYKSKSRSEVQKDGSGGVYWMRIESRWRAGPSMWVKITYPSSSSTALPPLEKGSENTQLLPKETFGWVTSQLSPLSIPGGPAWWYGNQMPSDSEVTRTVVIDTQQVKFYPSLKGVRWAENGEEYNESLPTTTPYLVRTFLGDIDFPSASQFSSAMDNPTSSPTLSGMHDIISNTTEEMEAAKQRHWAQGYDQSLNMYFAKQGEVIDIILVNRPSALSNSTEIHPWHMHSHKHWTRTIQPGTFNFTSLSKLYSTTPHSPSGYNYPIQRDTTVVYAGPGAAFLNQTVANPATNDGGYAVLRYKVEKENAGVFLLHCHIQFHLQMGMATVWTIAPEQLANQTGIYWPTDKDGVQAEGVKAPGKTKGKNNIEGLDWNYLKFNQSVEAVA